MRYCFGDCTLDTQLYTLHRAGHTLRLRPKVFQVLTYLVVHGERVVSRQELCEQVWPDQCISEAALESAIRAARQVLGDSGRMQQYIQTLHGHGYRFIAPVRGLPTTAEPVETEAPRLPLPRGVAPVAAQDLTPSADPPAAVSPLATEGPTPEPLSIAADPSGARAPLPDEEYKLVTALCVAVADTPALLARLDPEARYRLLQTMVGLAQEVVQAYAGTILHATSAGFMAVFGAPVAQEDHARRAVLAALELHQRLGVHPPMRVPPLASGLALRMGAHSSWVVGGSLGQAPQRLYTVVGEATALATRLQQQATPGTILLSAATAALVQLEVHVAPGGTLALDGGVPPIPVYVMQGLRQRQAGVMGRAPRVWSPFVGRAQELALLHDRLEAVRDGQGQVISLVGAPGMGKTRLLTEFSRGLTGQPVTVYMGQCLSYGQTTPYLPIRDILRQLCAIVEGDPVERRMAAVQRHLEEHGIRALEDVALVGQLLDLPSAQECLERLSPEVRYARTFALLRHLVFDTAQRQPLLLVVENLHWSDPTSEAWLASLVERLAGAAVLLLVTARSGYQPPWGAHSAATQVALAPLRAHDSRTVAQAVLGSVALPAARLQAIVAQAAGNPFFVEELAWHAADHGLAATPVPVPETVHAVLAARIDRLPDAAKALLQTAAVIGSEVPVPLLWVLAELPEEALQQGLAHLQATELLYETRLFPERAFTFKHALTHEVAYGSLLHERRRALHARIVETLEKIAGDRVVEEVERLAHHALRGEVWDKAPAYCRQAGEKALARSAYPEAVAAFEQALGALLHLPESRAVSEWAIDLRLALVFALARLGDLERVLAFLREAEALAERLGDQRRLAQVSSEMADVFRSLGDYEPALRAGQRALTLATALGDTALQIEANTQLGSIYYHRGDYGRAIEALRQTVIVLAHHSHRKRHDRPEAWTMWPYDRPDATVWPWSWLLVCLSQVGAFAEGHAMSADVLRLAEANEHPFCFVVATFGVGQLSFHQGDLAQAIAICERGLAVCQTHDLRDWLPEFAARLGYAYALAGRLPEALRLLEQAIGQNAALRGGAPCPNFVVWWGEAYLFAGQLDEAYTQAQRGLELSRAHQERGDEAYALRLLGAVAAQRHPPECDQAVDYYRQALALAKALGMRPLQAHCHRGLGTLYAQIGWAEQARVALSAAIVLYRAMDMTLWLPQAEATLAVVGGACNEATPSVSSSREGIRLAARG